MKHKSIYIIILTVIFTFISLNSVTADTIYAPCYGTNSKSDLFFRASTTGDQGVYLTKLDVSGGSGEIIFYNYGDEIGRKPTPGIIIPPDNTTSIKLESLNGDFIYLQEAFSNNPNGGHTVFEQCSDGSQDDSMKTIIKHLLDQLNVLQDIKIIINNNTTIINNIKNILNEHTTILNEQTTVLKKINSTIETIKNELQTDMKPKDYIIPKPPDLDDYKPDQPDKSYEDNNDYFKDQGPADEPPEMPKAPDPEKWEGVDDPPPEMEKDDELEKENELDKDDELEQETELEKENELDKDDELEQETELEKENELDKDTELDIDDELKQDDEFQQENEFNQNHQYDKDKEYEQDNFYDQTENDYELRWKSENGNFK